MQKHTVLVLLGTLLLVCAGAFALPSLLGGEDVPVGRWTTGEEVEVTVETGDAEPAAAEASALVERDAVASAGADRTADDRVSVTLRGRVVDKFARPVADASVWLDFGRGGQRGGGPSRQRRVPDPVQTDAEGRFAFQGQTFRNLRVSLQVRHPAHALGLFDKDVGDVGAEVDLGDLALQQGGELRGRVTDLDGNGIAGAELRLDPENNNRLRFVRDRERVLPNLRTDLNGYFRTANLAAGEWSVTASAKRHTEERSPVFMMEESGVHDLDDIRLGPGYEVTGHVRSVQGQPIANATVVLRSERRGGGNRAEPPRGGREHRATTDEQGAFSIDHLPASPMRLEADADGYLDYRQDAIDPTLGRPIDVTLQDGLRISGTVRDRDGAPVTKFAVRALRVRGLQSGGPGANLADLATRLRDGNIDEATRGQLRGQLEMAREAFSGEARRLNRDDAGGRGGRGGARELGRAEPHPDGTFVATGLQEGFYEVHVQSPDHARYRSAEIELRLGTAPPDLTIQLDDGVFVGGVVLDEKHQPVRNARVELRSASADDNGPRRRGGRNGNAGNNNAGNAGFDFENAGREFMRQAAGVAAPQEATTDAEGTFVIKHVVRGSYRLRAEARGYAAATTEAFDLQADRSGFELTLGTLGAIAGTVRGFREGEHAEVRVAAVPVDMSQGGGGLGAMFRGRGGNGGPFGGVPVAADGSYRIDELTPGAYLVRAWIGSPQELMRELGPAFFAGELTPDAQVRGGDVTKLDLQVTHPAVGRVTGNVMHNGAPADGAHVELRRQDEGGVMPTGRGPGGGPGRAGMFGGFGRSMQATVGASGQFTIEGVPAGSYRLRVTMSRNRGTLHEEVVQVVADATTERTVSVQTTSVRGTVTRDDGGNPAELRGNVTLLANVSEVPANLAEWRRDNATIEAPVSNGAFTIEFVKPGQYLALLRVPGRERTSTPIVVDGRDREISLPVGKAMPPRGAEGAANPSVERPARR